jgi:hypothetical protein
VVETSYGFHVLQRHAPPSERHVSGARIVIGHDDAPWLARHLARGPIPRRSWSEAWALARRIYAEARERPADFGRLVQQYSEHRDALRQGDFGSWSSREYTPFPVEVDTLLGLDVGEVAPPRDTLFGIQIIVRTPERPRQRLAMARVELSFDPALPDSDPRSENAVRRRAQDIARVVQTQPTRLAEFQKDACCEGVRQWVEGQGNVFYERALSTLAIGQSTPEAVRQPDRYAILERREPDSVVPQVRLELPAPTEPDLSHLALQLGGLSGLPKLAMALRPSLNLPDADALRYLTLNDVEQLAKIPDAAERKARFDRAQGELQALLGRDRYALYQSDLSRQLSELVLAQASARGPSRFILP